MPEYYDSWSANKRKKNPTRPQARLSSDRLWLQYHRQPSTSAASAAITSTPLTLDASAALTTVISPRGQPSHPSAIGHSAISPVQPRHSSAAFRNTNRVTSDNAKDSITSSRKPVSTWRFSKALFDSSPSPTGAYTSLDADFDDVDKDNDDDDDDDDGNDGDEEEQEHPTRPSRTYGTTQPRLPIAPGPTLKPSTPNQRRSLLWADYRPRLIQVQEQQEHDNDIERLDSRGDPFSGTRTYSSSMARSSPSLPASVPVIDDPDSTSTFNACLYPRSILRGAATVERTTAYRASTNRIEASRRRPWSQVIWESPVLSDPSQQPQRQHYQQHQQHQPRLHSHDHSVTVCARPQGEYPALTKDLFTPRAVPDKERVISKSVRINIDGDVTNTNTITASVGGSNTRVRSRTLDGKSKDKGLPGNKTLANIPARRELSNGKKHLNRLSLGAGFYASIEPVYLSAATPSTPKRKRLLVRLPSRPQSVLIPSTAHIYPNGLGAHLSVLLQQGTVGQPLSLPGACKRRRHQSQQLEMSDRSSIAVSIPWLQLAPMDSHDNAKTFHGIGSLPVVSLPILQKGGSQDNALESSSSDLQSPVPALISSLQLQSQQKAQQQSQQETPPKLAWLSKTHLFQQHVSKNQRPSQPQVQPACSPQISPRFLPALSETSLSIMLKKPSVPSSSTSSIIRASESSSSAKSTPSRSPSMLTSTNPSETNQHLHHQHSPHHQQQKHSFRHSILQTRKSLPNSTRTPPSSKSRRAVTILSSARPFSGRNSSNHNGSNQNSSSSNSNSNSNRRNGISNSSINELNESNSNDTNGSSNINPRQSILINSTSRQSSWKRKSSGLFPTFSLVSYESGGLLGEIKNMSTTICTNAPSSIVAPGTPLPPGVVVSTGVPTPPPSFASLSPAMPMSIPTPSSSTPAAGLVPPISGTPSEFSRLCKGSEYAPGDTSQGASTTSRSGASDQSETMTEVLLWSACVYCKKDLDEAKREPPVDNEDEVPKYCVHCWPTDNDLFGEQAKDECQTLTEVETDEEEASKAVLVAAGIDDSVMIQKSHVAVYEINPRWGSRLMMLFVTVGGLMCVTSGGLCAEHHCKDLQICQDEHQGHGNWCGPSGVEGAPYMLTVGLSMCIFGVYALVYLRSPISRLVGYSEIDQFL